MVGFGLACVLWLGMLVRNNPKSVRWWVISGTCVLTVPTAVTLFALEHQIPLTLWFCAYVEIAVIVVICLNKAIAQIYENELVQGVAWSLPLLAFIAVGILCGDRIAEFNIPYNRVTAKYFVYGGTEKRTGSLAVTPDEHYYSLVNEVRDALPKREKKGASMTEAEIKSILEAAYDRPFHRRGADLESTLAYYSKEILQKRASYPEKTAMLGIIGACQPNLILLVRYGYLSEQTASNVRRVLDAEKANGKR